jgi:hypothetical protein
MHFHRGECKPQGTVSIALIESRLMSIQDMV